MFVPDPSKEDFEIPNLSLPKLVSRERVADRRSFLEVVDRVFRSKMEFAEYAKMDAYAEQALNMILSPEVQTAFDLSRSLKRRKMLMVGTPLGRVSCWPAAGGGGEPIRDSGGLRK